MLSLNNLLENRLILKLYSFKANQVNGVHCLNINCPKDGEKTGNLGKQLAPALELAMSLATPHGVIPWAISFIQSTTANQHQLNGKGAGEGFADGAAWLWNFFQRPESLSPAVSMMSQLKNWLRTAVQSVTKPFLETSVSIALSSRVHKHGWE